MKSIRDVEKIIGKELRSTDKKTGTVYHDFFYNGFKVLAIESEPVKTDNGKTYKNLSVSITPMTWEDMKKFEAKELDIPADIINEVRKAFFDGNEEMRDHRGGFSYMIFGTEEMK